MKSRVAIVGSGPAGLMAASQLAASGCTVSVFEKQPGAGRKLLIAGGSGLNVSNSLPESEFATHYAGNIGWIDLFKKFSVHDWLAFIAKLGLETFEGTSGRYFVREMKASGLLRRWLASLEDSGVAIHYEAECAGWQPSDKKTALNFRGKPKQEFDAVVFALGGGSWLREPAAWPQIFAEKNLIVDPFQPANAGFSVAWSQAFLSEAANQPLKNIEFISAAGRRKGDVIITEYGLEGTPVYFYGKTETCFIDLKPDLTLEQIAEKLAAVTENLSPLRRAQKKLNLDAVTQALLYHEAPPESRQTIADLAKLLKKFPVKLGEPRPLTEAISSAGGLSCDEIDADFQLRRYPGIFVAGEMLDWNAPTGGFLIQACVSQGFAAAQGVLKYLRA